MTDDDRLAILSIAQDFGLSGMGGECGETAIAINKLLFDGRGQLVASVNKHLWRQGRLVGHVGVRVDGVVWDAEGTYDDEEAMEEFMSWGMVDPADPDYEFPSEDDAYDVLLVEPTEKRVRMALPFCGTVSPYDAISLAIEEYE